MSVLKEFYVLLRCNGNSAESITWKSNGRKWVYGNNTNNKKRGDKIILVREVKRKKSK